MKTNFERVPTGITFKRVAVLVVVAVILTVLMGSAVARTVFSSLGEPVGGRKWSYIVALLVSLSVAGAGSGLKTFMPRRFRTVANTLSATASGALLGFFYGGLAAGKNPAFAVAAAVIGGILIGAGSLRFRTGVGAVAVAVAGAVGGYGFAFWLWAVALAFLSGEKLIEGFFLSGLSLVYIGLTVSSLLLAVKEIKRF
ncbi:low-complexity protein [Microcoleus sp. FACHB-672]|uniref:low-complexity protein n=1 Tax=Microcoleus sp. FACHB-672 TaxID=2692825 RepID=UPI001688B7D9|nr:low-complexity protein [Microcoleus sp. FACHB-672]MBD2042710.1 low-complexity protein [Microcoleus sp. FACHB-672]